MWHEIVINANRTQLLTMLNAIYTFYMHQFQLALKPKNKDE